MAFIEIPLWFIVSSIFLQHEEWDVRQKYESSMIYRTVFARTQLMRRTKILPSLGRQQCRNIGEATAAVAKYHVLNNWSRAN